MSQAPEAEKAALAELVEYVEKRVKGIRTNEVKALVEFVTQKFESKGELMVKARGLASAGITDLKTEYGLGFTEATNLMSLVKAIDRESSNSGDVDPSTAFKKHKGEHDESYTVLEPPEVKDNRVVFQQPKKTIDSAMFPPTVVFARDAYTAVCDQVLRVGDMLGHIITGTPGIGKSMFMFYMLYQLFFEDAKVAGDNGAKSYGINHLLLLTSWGKYHIRRRDDVVEWRELDERRDTLHYRRFYRDDETRGQTAVFWDPGRDKDIEALVQPTRARLQMVLASPNETRYLKFFDQHVAFRKRVYMPLWEAAEFEELRTALFETVDKPLSDGLAGVYGPNPRLVLQAPSVTKADHGAIADERNRLMRLMGQLALKDLATLLKMEKIEDQSRTSSLKYYHVLLQLDVKRSESGTWLLGEDPRVLPASDFVRKELTFIFLAKKLEESAQTLKDFLNAASGDGKAYAGWMFEWYAHYEVGKMRELACIPLGGDPSSQREFVCDWSGGREVFRKLDDIKRDIQPNKYYLPAHQTLPSIDSFVVLDGQDANGNDVRRVLAFQMTVASTHPVKRHGVEKLQELLDCEDKKPDEYHLVFVAPEHDDESKVMTSVQKFLNKDGSVSRSQKSVFSQWRLEVPLSDLRLMKKCKYGAPSSNSDS